jgi:adenylate kinase family enzyme
MFDSNSRILVVGTSGSGKTTLARELSKRLRIKDIELDALFWKERWAQSGLDEFREKIRKAMEGAAGYVIHGNYNKVKDLTWANVDTVIWLDYSRYIVMWRVLKRTITRIVTQEELWSGNKETFRNSFLAKDAIVFWAWKTYRKRKEQYTLMMREKPYGSKEYLVFKHPRETRKYLEALRSR